MGVTHFAPVGTRPGAVTSALAYLKHNQDNFSGFQGDIIETVVVFVSPEVRNGRCMIRECTNNEYGSLHGPEWKNRTLLEIIKKFVVDELQDVMPDKGSIWICVVKPNNYNDCFDKMARTLLKFARGVGKHIWMNFTGGTNVMNIALLEVALLSGRVARLYYTFLSDTERYGRYLQPPSKDKSIFQFVETPFMKQIFDESYYRVLGIYRESNDWLSESQVLSSLKGRHPDLFSTMSIGMFRRDYLNIMDRRELLRRGQTNKLTDYGKMALDKIDSPLFKTLVRPKSGKEAEITRLTEHFNELQKLWIKS